MNRKQKIIVSVTGIFLVLLIIVGLTYAYFLTQIKGNTNNKSISVTTADLELTYYDGNGNLNVSGKLLPGNDVEFLTEDGTLVKEKTFSVENTGDTTVDNYAVILENLDVYYSTTFENEIQGAATYLNHPETLTYTLTCKSNIDGNNCFGKTNEQFPTTEDILTTNSIEKDEIHTYTLTMYYANADYDQSSDMNKSLDAKINIIDTKGTADIKGEVTDFSEGDTVLVSLDTDVAYEESESDIKNLSNTNQDADIKLLADSDTIKTSYLNKDGEYKVVGLPAGNYTITVQDASESLTIQKGETASVDTTNKVVTVTDVSRIVTVNLDITNKSASLSEEVKNTPIRLFQYVIEDAKKAANENSKTRAILDTQTSPEFTGTSGFIYVDNGISSESNVYGGYRTYSNTKYFTYGDSYTYDESTNTYTLINKDGSPINYVQGVTTLKDKYVVSTYGSNTAGVAEYSGLSQIYFVEKIEDTKMYYITLYASSRNNYVTYGDSYELDQITGNYLITNKDGSNVEAVKYRDNFKKLKNKYIVNTGTSSTSVSTMKNLKTIYKISENSTEDFLKYYKITSHHESTESKMLIAEDDYGNSFYYRGGVKNNYINFAGFNWRIVRINGDGTLRLIIDSPLEKVKREGLDEYAGTFSAFKSSYGDNSFVGYMHGLKTESENVCVLTSESNVKSIDTTITDKNSCSGEWMTAYNATHMNINDSKIKQAVDKFYETYIENEENNYHYEKYLADTLFCGDKTLASNGVRDIEVQLGYAKNSTYYAAGERLNYYDETAKPSLKCAEGDAASNSNLTEKQKAFSRYTSSLDTSEYTSKGILVNNDLKYPIALLSADELVMAGSFNGVTNKSIYLHDTYITEPPQFTDIVQYVSWWTMTPLWGSNYPNNMYCRNSALSSNPVDTGSYGVRPVINLRADLLYSSGDGTITNPYNVELPE